MIIIKQIINNDNKRVSQQVSKTIMICMNACMYMIVANRNKMVVVIIIIPVMLIIVIVRIVTMIIPITISITINNPVL